MYVWMDFEEWEVGVCVWYGMVWQRFLAHLGSHNVWDVGVWDGLCVSSTDGLVRV